ncbi:ribulose-phosphate 3-epimerase [Buchnera aphidicola (Ceratoglyphina bambusae)]|uniref:ribulose-phosphate 3-epimerase n=1 Tax=Buchnera aphidicola TaxID=9 RepID=UPI0031B88949
MKKFFIVPSILSANFACLKDEIECVLNSGADFIHFDIMDNHYVSNLTFGPLILESLKNSNIKFNADIHLMTEKVDSLIPSFANNNAKFITFHPESTNHIDKTISLIKSFGCKAGLAINPSTSLHHLDYTINKLDLILVMSVNPGFGKQKFLDYVLKKIEKIRKLIDKKKLNIILEVDGGIKKDNIINILNAGANSFVIGSEIFSSKNYKKTIYNIRKIINNYNNKKK